METAFAEYLSHAPVFIRRFTGEIVYWTQGAEELYGFTPDEAIGRSSHSLLQTKFPAPLAEIDAELERESCWEGLLGHTRADGLRIWTQSRWRLRRGGEGRTRFVVETNTDVSDRENLARELDHRVKNMLAVVQGLAHLSFSSGEPERLEQFGKRLAALASANDLLLRDHWRGAGLKEVILRALEPFGARERVSLDGEDVALEPRSVVAYRLAFHELPTNALKHGAFSAPAGKVDISWALLGEHHEQVHLFWRESGGPPPSRQPDSSGGGMELLKRVVSAELGVPITIRLEPGGLVCEFDGPIQKQPVFMPSPADPSP